MKVGFVQADHKDFGGFVDNLKKVLKKEFGLYLYEDPITFGSDEIGVIITNKKQTPMQREELSMYGNS